MQIVHHNNNSMHACVSTEKGKAFNCRVCKNERDKDRELTRRTTGFKIFSSIGSDRLFVIFYIKVKISSILVTFCAISRSQSNACYAKLSSINCRRTNLKPTPWDNNNISNMIMMMMKIVNNNNRCSFKG